MTGDILKLVVVGAIIIVLGALYLSMRPWLRRRAPEFSEDAQRAIGFARVEAEQLKSTSIEPGHLLLGLLHIPDPTLALLIPLQDHDSIRQEVRDRIEGAALVTYRDDLPFSDEARQALVAAAREARGFSSPVITSKHLLLGLLHADTSVAALVLRERGLRLESVREQVAGWPQVLSTP